jgi:flagellar biosynthetic protein FliO
VIYWCLALTGPEPLTSGPEMASSLRNLVAVAVVLGLVVVFAWLVRRGVFGTLGRRGPSGIRVETAVPLGERRSLAVVVVEGRRLLIGMTPAQVTLLTELQPESAGFAGTLEKAIDPDTRGVA